MIQTSDKSHNSSRHVFHTSTHCTTLHYSQHLPPSSDCSISLIAQSPQITRGTSTVDASQRTGRSLPSAHPKNKARERRENSAQLACPLGFPFRRDSHSLPPFRPLSCQITNRTQSPSNLASACQECTAALRKVGFADSPASLTFHHHGRFPAQAS